MSTNTAIGTTALLGYPLGVRSSVLDYVSGFSEDFDVDAIVSELRDLINERLPAGVVLIGNELYTDVEDNVELPSYPEDADSRLISESEWVVAIESHDLSGEGE